jgi:hypothetical protein
VRQELLLARSILRKHDRGLIWFEKVTRNVPTI